MPQHPTPSKRPVPKVQAAGAGTVIAAVLAFLLPHLGVNVDHLPGWELSLAGGAIATALAYIKRNGLAGVLDLIEHGTDTADPAPAPLGPRDPGEVPHA